MCVELPALFVIPIAFVEPLGDLGPVLPVAELSVVLPHADAAYN